MTTAACLACERIAAIEAGTYPHAVARTTAGYVVLAQSQYYRGYTEFLAKECVVELHELGEPRRSEHLHDMACVAQAVFDAFAPRQLNYEALGNSCPHLHWHLIPRPHDDPHPNGPAWRNPEFAEAVKHTRHVLGDAERRDACAALGAALTKTGIVIEQRY